jgi:hypothetical protein
MTTKRLSLIVAAVAPVVVVAVAVPVTSGAKAPPNRARSPAVAPALVAATSATSGGKALPTIRGSLSPGDTVQTDRLLRNGIPSDCSTTKTNPGLAGGATARRADAYMFTNPKENKAQCVNVTLQTACGPFDSTRTNGWATAYSGVAYDPANPSAGWIGDPGDSTSPMRFSFIVEPGATFEVVVATVDTDVLNCHAYTLDVAFGKVPKPATTSAAPKPGGVDHK